jgi:hypothetical protein
MLIMAKLGGDYPKTSSSTIPGNQVAIDELIGTAPDAASAKGFN